MTGIHHYIFLTRLWKITLLFAIGATILGTLSSAWADGENGKRRLEVVAVYYPHWHNYDHASSWKGEGWSEWESLKSAIPRLPGHHQPLKPSWGYFDESDPKWSEREIDLAARHGIDVFLYDWYWYSGVKNMEEAPLDRSRLLTVSVAAAAQGSGDLPAELLRTLGAKASSTLITEPGP